MRRPILIFTTIAVLTSCWALVSPAVSTRPLDANQSNPRSALDWYHSGLRYEALGMHEEEIEAYSRAIHLDPLLFQAFVNRGNAYLELGQLELALADMNRAVELNPKDSLSFYGRGQVRTKMRDFESAAANYSRAIELDPNQAVFFHSRGHAFEKSGRFEAAENDFMALTKLAPLDAEGWANLALMQAKQNKLSESKRSLRRCLRLMPNHEKCRRLRSLLKLTPNG